MTGFHVTHLLPAIFENLGNIPGNNGLQKAQSSKIREWVSTILHETIYMFALL